MCIKLVCTAINLAGDRYTFVTHRPYTVYAETAYDYDIKGNMTQVLGDATASTPITTTLTYNFLGQKTAMADPDMGEWTYEYNDTGTLKSQTDALDQTTCFYYDDVDRLVTKSITTTTTTCPTTAPAATSDDWRASYTYGTSGTATGQLTKVEWWPDATENYDAFEYDSEGRLVSQTRVIDGAAYTMRTLSFDSLERPLVVQYPNGELQTMTYDNEGQDTLAVDGFELVEGLGYNARGQLVFMDLATDLQTTYTYATATDNFRLTRIHSQFTGTLQSGDGGTRLDLQYLYDDVGNIIKIKEYAVVPSGGPGGGTSTLQDTQNFIYDHRNRLVKAAGYHDVDDDLDYDYAYNYDEVGNIQSVVITDTSQITSTYAYTGTQAHAVTRITDGSSTDEMDYDGNGNMIWRVDATGEYSQTFDTFNRMVTITDTVASEATHYYYDAGEIRTRTVYSGSVTHYPFPGYEVHNVGTVTETARTTFTAAGQAVAQREVTPLYFEDFEIAATDWVTSSGSWSVTTISGEKWYSQSATSGEAITEYELDQSGVIAVDWAMNVDTTGTIASGLIFMGKQSFGNKHYNGYLVWQTNSTLYIYEYVNGTLTQRAYDAAIIVNSGGDRVLAYRVTYDDTSGKITVWRDGVEKLTWTDSASPITNGQYIGLRTNSAAADFDDIRVTTIGDTYYIHSDHLGSTSTLSDSDGQLVSGASARHLPFGGYRQSPTAGLTERGYTGHKTEEMGLIYMNARFYAPYATHFLTPDPIVPEIQNPQSHNRYSYVMNNPIARKDPSGHCPIGPDGDPVCDDGRPEPKDSSIVDPCKFSHCILEPTPEETWHITVYADARQGETVNPALGYSKTNELVEVQVCYNGQNCETLTLPFRFLFGAEGVMMQGSGLMTDGRFVHIGNVTGEWVYLDNGSRDYFQTTGEFYFDFGHGRPDSVAYSTVATGPDYDFGTIVYVPELAHSPSGGYFIVNDRGDGIQNGDMDIYVGAGSLTTARLATDMYFGSNRESADLPVFIVIVVPGNEHVVME